MAFRSVDMKYLIDEHGQNVTMRTYTRGSYDPTTGTASESTNQTYTVKCYFGNYVISEIDGTNIQIGDRKAILNITDTSGNTIPEPVDGDQLEGEGDSVRVVNVRKIFSAGAPMVYICQVRE